MIQGLSLPLVFLAGVVSFASPCVLPLLPGYVAIIGGAGAPRIRASLLFLAGFAAAGNLGGAKGICIGVRKDGMRLRRK